MHRRELRTVIPAAFAVLTLGILATAGPLDPPSGPIASTYKTLADVEPRTAVNAVNTPGTGSCVFKITQPGSYYLTGNIVGVLNKNGIEIAAPDVTLDLSGFAVQGISGSRAGVAVLPTGQRVTIRNGSISGWGWDGIDSGFNLYGVIERVTASGNGAGTSTRTGIRAGGYSRIADCTSVSNTGYGITCNDACTLTNCDGSTNTLYGVSFGASCTLRDCVARNNTVGGLTGQEQETMVGCSVTNQFNIGTGWGIYVGIDAHLTACSASRYNIGVQAGNGSTLEGFNADGNNTGIVLSDNCNATSCVAVSNTGVGISANSGANISGCTANANGSDNIVVQQRSSITNCVANSSVNANGINAAGVTNVITGCTANGNKLMGVRAAQRCRVSGCLCRENGASGVNANYGGTVTDCYCSGNAQCGILCDAGGVVTMIDNTCSENGAGQSGAGIRVTSVSCRIEHNTLVYNYRNLDVQGTNTLIVRNSLTSPGAGGQYSIAVNNSYGPMVNVGQVGDISATPGASHPMANFIH